MPLLESRRFLENARDEASGYLGREMTDIEWNETYPLAAQTKKTASEEDGLLTTTNITPQTINCQF